MARTTLVSLSALLLAACGGGGGGGGSSSTTGSAPATNSTCTLTLSGAISGTSACLIFWHQIPTNVDSQPYFGVTAGVPPNGVVFDIYQTPPALGTYTSADAHKAYGMVQSGSRRWRVSKGYTPGVPDTGSYDVVITGLTDVGFTGSVHFWELDGTLDLVLDPDPSTTATGQVTVHATF